MELDEIVLQGITEFPPSARVTLGKGLTALHPVSAGQGGALVQILAELLSPTTTEDPLASLAAADAGANRVGANLIGRDGTAYRVVKDLKSGQTALMRQEAGTMAPVSQRAADIQQMVTAQLGFPQGDVMRGLFLTRLEDLPSQQTSSMSDPDFAEAAGGRSKSFADQPLPPGFSSEGDAAYSHLSDVEKQNRLKEIEGQIAQSETVKELEFQLDGLQKELFDVEEKSRPVAALREEVRLADQELSHFADVRDVPGDFRDQVDRALTVQRSHTTEMADLDQKLMAMEAAHEVSARNELSLGQKIRNAMDDNFVKYGLLVGIGAIVIAAVGAAASIPKLQWLAFVDVPAFFVALLGGFRAIGFAEEKGLARTKLLQVVRDKERLTSRAALDRTAFEGLLAGVGLDPRNLNELDSILETLEHKRSLLVRADGAKARLKDLLKDPDVLNGEAKQGALSQKVKALEAQLYEAGGYLVDPTKLRAEADEIRRSLSVGSPSSQGAAPGPASNAAPQRRGVSSGEIVAALLKHASDLLMSSPAAVGEKIEARASQYLAGMTQQRFVKTVWRNSVDLYLVDGHGNEIPFKDLAPLDQDSAYLSVKLTVLEAFVRQTRMPIVLDRVFDGFAPDQDAFFTKLLLFLANYTQVFVTTARQGIAQGATQRITLAT